MYCESGIFPLLVADTTTVTAVAKEDVYVAEGGELPPPPEDPPKN